MAQSTAALRITDASDQDCVVDDATLVERITSGDRQSFEVLYDRHSAPLFRTALALSRDRSVAEELLQEAFLRAYRHIARVRLAPEASLRPWLHRIIVNLAYDWSARERRSAGPLDTVAEKLLKAPSATSPERIAEQRELQRLVTLAIEELPFKHRIVVVLYYVHDMDLQSIAGILNVPTGTVKSRLFYARAQLRQQIESDAQLAAGLEVRYAST